jgi:hypothetical protein
MAEHRHEHWDRAYQARGYLFRAAPIVVLSLLPACGGTADRGPADAAGGDSAARDADLSDAPGNPETAPVDTGLSESSGDDGPAGCTGIGTACSGAGGTCPGGLRCYAGGGGGYCGPPTNCAGFVGKACPTGLVCVVPTLCADCDGTCVSPAQLACICPANQANAMCPDGG